MRRTIRKTGNQETPLDEEDGEDVDDADADSVASLSMVLFVSVAELSPFVAR